MYFFQNSVQRNRKYLKAGKRYEVSSNVDVIKVPEGENREDTRDIFEGKKGLELFLIIEMHETSSSKITINSTQAKNVYLNK